MNTTDRRFLRNGVLVNYREWTPEDDKLLRQELVKENTVPKISKLLNRSYGSVMNYMCSVGLHSNSPKWAKGRRAEEAAQEFLLENGFEILKRGSYQTTYDFLVKKQGEVYSINVKHVTEWIAVHVVDFLALAKYGIPVLLLRTESKWLWVSEFQNNISHKS